MLKKTLILIVGPTAVGKTALCVRLAKQLDAEIFSCDSRQFYKEMSIGTAKPKRDEMDGVLHHFINNLSINETYTAGQFEKESVLALERYFKEKPLAIMTGGSGLFAKAITHGFDKLPQIPQSVREKLKVDLSENGIAFLQKELAEKDPSYFEKIDESNPQRVIRALEVIRFTGETFSSFLNKPNKARSFEIIKIGLEMPRKDLYKRINDRVELMLKQGLVREVENLKAYRDHPALQTVGYKEVFEFLDNKLNLKETTELIQRNTRRYAKRQLTWFKNQDSFTWFSPLNQNQIFDFIEQITLKNN